MALFKPFTEKEAETVKAEYLLKPLRRISKELNITPPRIKKFLERNNLVVPKSVSDKFRSETLFKLGNPAFNKGMEIHQFMSPEAIERAKKSRFKKGHVPANTGKNGDISWRKGGTDEYYKYIRISKANWKLESHIIWEKEHGKINKKNVICFIDGNTKKTNIENLKMVSRAHKMFENHPQNYPNEVIPILVSLNNLQKEINNLENGD